VARRFAPTRRPTDGNIARATLTKSNEVLACQEDFPGIEQAGERHVSAMNDLRRFEAK